jgi:hypothetical protein
MKIEVIEVSKYEEMALAGRNWKAALAAVPHTPTAKVVEIIYGSMDRLREGEDPSVLLGLAAVRPHLPVGYVWLREVDGRAFLYYQN